MSQREKPIKVAYWLPIFPALSETFILNEILELRRQGLDIAIFSASKPNEGVIHKEAEKLVRETYYFTNFRNLNKFKKVFIYLYVHFYFLIRSPLRYLKTVWFAYTAGKYKYIYYGFRVAAYYAFVFKKSNVSHIHVHFADDISERAMLASMLSGIPYSFTIHAHDIFIKFRLMDQKIKFAQFVIAISSYNKKFVKERCHMANENKIHVVHCGVDLKKMAVFKSNGKSESRPFVILSVGRLVETKGFEYLLRACSILLKKGISDVICQIVGHGPLKRQLEDLIVSLGVEGIIRFLGPLPSDKVFTLLKEADLAVLPSVTDKDGNMDGIPVYLMEAMALEKPVISTYISGIPELVKDGAGILVPPGDPRALASAIEKIYYMDVESKRRMGKRGCEIVEMEFNVRKEAKKIKDLFISSIVEANNRVV